MKLHINKITSVILIFILCIGGLNVFADIDTEDITLVISQVYVTNNGSYNQRFIELYNNSKNDIALSKYTLQYAASSANTCTSKLTFSQDDVIKAKSFFLVACGAVSKNGAALEPDAYWPQALAPNAKVAICTASELQALPELSALPSGNIIEYVPWGSGTPQLGTALTNLSSTLAGFREHYSFNTGADFILKTPTPRNSKTVGQTVTLTPPEKITSLDIVSQTIDNNMVDVSLDDIILFTFNQNIKEGSGSFHITPECGGWANLSGKMLKIQHNDFEYGTTYTLTATEGFLTNEDGSQLSTPFSLTFTTEEKQKNIITAKNAKIDDDKLDFSGKITFVDGTQRIYVEDTTGAICLDLTPYNVTNLEQNVNPGDILTVKNGVRNVYYGMATVKFDNAPLSISVEKQAEDLTNVTYVTIAQANNMECRLVQIKNITVGDFDEAKSFTTLTDATGSINAYSADALLASFRGRQINLVAAVGSYNGIMQLRLRSAADVVLGGDDTLPPVITYSDTINNANIHSDYKCDFQVSDERRLLNVAAFYKIDDNSFQPIALSNKNDNYYFVISKEELSAGSNLTFYITAFDGTNTTTAPEKTEAIEKTTLITSV